MLGGSCVVTITYRRAAVARDTSHVVYRVFALTSLCARVLSSDVFNRSSLGGRRAREISREASKRESNEARSAINPDGRHTSRWPFAICNKESRAKECIRNTLSLRSSRKMQRRTTTIAAREEKRAHARATRKLNSEKHHTRGLNMTL